MNNFFEKKKRLPNSDYTNIYGQGYDDSANMAGRFKGTQAVVRETYPKVLYVHCAVHSLNLCLLLVIIK